MARIPRIDTAAAAAATFNMTPMIDVVFQLIIFLMLANDMSRKEIEDLALPEAFNAAEDDGIAEKSRVIVNLLRSETGGPPGLKVRGTEMDLAGLQQILRPAADQVRGSDGARASELFVLIRADRSSRWQDVQWVMQACADSRIGIYKLQFATTNPDLREGK